MPNLQVNLINQKKSRVEVELDSALTSVKLGDASLDRDLHLLALTLTLTLTPTPLNSIFKLY